MSSQTPSPVAQALEQYVLFAARLARTHQRSDHRYKFRTHYKAYVSDVAPTKRQRGLFTVVFVHSGDGLPMVSVHFVKQADATHDEYAAAFLRSQPQLGGWLRDYDPAREFLIAAAFTKWQADEQTQAEEQIAQSARLTFEQLAELDSESYAQQQAAQSQGTVRPSAKKPKKSSRRNKHGRIAEVSVSDITPIEPAVAPCD